ncbi:MAG: amidase [Deltaproteobacteria bacterium]|nr:amidase [Deltaproteobacteria bacterium]
MDATGLAELVRKGEVEPLELVDTAIERIERLNPTLNAVVTPMYEAARVTATSELPEGPFTGVPFLLKDLVAEYAGFRLTEGSAFLKDFVSGHDSELVARLKRAGLIIVGKSNTPEFGILPTTESKLLGPCHNPWDTSRTPGGSSGGSAAAVASGMVPMAHGNDGGGSIRIPASCCGLFGLKPTRGRNPLGPEYGDILFFLVAEHALTRSVRDSAALLDATSGPDFGDTCWAPSPKRPFIKEVGANPGKLRIAFTTKPSTNVATHPDCVKAAEDAAKLCADLGHEVVEAAPTLDSDVTGRDFGLIWAAITAWTIDYWARRCDSAPSPDQFEVLTWAQYQRAREIKAVNYMKAIQNLEKATRNVAKFFSNFDVWLTPTLGEPPVALGSFESPPDKPLQGLFRSASFTPFTPICNVTGQPAMSVPLYWDESGLPIGSQFIARFGDEATLFRLAAQLEEARPWAKRRPPVSA